MELEDSDAPSTFQPTLFNASGTHTRPNTTSRHRQFMNWLIQRYGADFLSSGGGVLDVAGGAGGLAFELAFRKSIPCVVVDPRQMRVNPRQWRAMAYEQRRATEQQSQSNKPLEGGDGNGNAGVCASPSPAEHLKSAEVCDADASDSFDDTGPSVPPEYAQAWAQFNLHPHCVPRQICSTFDPGFATGEYANVWKSCSVVVGMHPDQATEPIVREALAHGKPFAVVPCCTFPNSNSHRLNADGTRVRSHEDFCSYLERLGTPEHPVERSHLLFAGRNVIVHSSQRAASAGDGPCDGPVSSLSSTHGRSTFTSTT